MDPQLNDFYTHLSDAVVTTNDFSEGTKYRKREKVDQYAYCGLNQMYRSYLSFDIDRRNSANYFEHANLPTPTIITINPQNAHCHYLYRLKTPVAYHANSRSAPQDYFEAIQKEMEDRLRADLAYNHKAKAIRNIQTIRENAEHRDNGMKGYAAMEAIHDVENALAEIQSDINGAIVDVNYAKSAAQRSRVEERLAKLMEHKRRLEMQLIAAKARQLNSGPRLM